MYGQPDEIKSYPAGGVHISRAEQTFTYGFEQWRYSRIAGLGDNVIFDFADYGRTTTLLESSLNAPFRQGPRLDFLSRIHTDSKQSTLSHLWLLAKRCAHQVQPSSFEEDFLILSKNLLSLYREVRAQVARVPAAKASTREELFRRLQVAREYLHSHVDRRISLDEVAREACVSRYHLHRAFTRVFRQTPHAYLTRLRLARAHSFLESGRAVTDVATDVGFTSLSAFTRLFRGHYGVPPSSVHKIRKIGQAHR